MTTETTEITEPTAFTRVDRSDIHDPEYRVNSTKDYGSNITVNGKDYGNACLWRSLARGNMDNAILYCNKSRGIYGTMGDDINIVYFVDTFGSDVTVVSPYDGGYYISSFTKKNNTSCITIHLSNAHFTFINKCEKVVSAWDEYNKCNDELQAYYMELDIIKERVVKEMDERITAIKAAMRVPCGRNQKEINLYLADLERDLKRANAIKWSAITSFNDPVATELGQKKQEACIRAGQVAY